MKTLKIIFGIVLILLILSVNFLGTQIKEDFKKDNLKYKYQSELLLSLLNERDCLLEENLIYQRKFETQCEIQEYLEHELGECVTLQRNYYKWLDNLKK